MLKEITSPQNALIRDVIRLRSKARARRESGLCVIEGLREVERAARSGVYIETLLYRPDLITRTALESRLALPSQSTSTRPLMHVHCAPQVMSRIAYRADVPNVVALGRWSEQRVFPEPKAHVDSDALPDLLLILEGVEKPGNLGALLRTADALGVTGVILVDCPVEISHPNVIRNSLGAVFALAVVSLTFDETRALVEARGISLYVTHLNAAAIAPAQAPLHKACALVLGAESTGARARWLTEASSQPLLIPMTDSRVVDSLNVSVAAAIVMYEAARQRASSLDQP